MILLILNIIRKLVTKYVQGSIHVQTFLMASLILLAALFATNNLLSNVMAQENGYEDDSYNNNSSDLYTSWEDFTPGNTDIFFKSSHALHDPINLSNTTGTSQFSQVSSSDDNVYVIWEDNISGNKEILFRASHDNGQTFGNIINLSNNNSTSSEPLIFSHGNNVYAVWVDYISNIEILFRASHDYLNLAVSIIMIMTLI